MSIQRFRSRAVIEAVKFWNEPNNLSHWDFQIDTDWSIYAAMVKAASAAAAAEAPGLPRVLGGISPIDPEFLRNLREKGVMEHVDAIAIHGFPLDWNHWMIDEWPAKLAEVREAVPELPVWVTEVGVSTFGAEEVQEFGLKRTAELLIGTSPRIHWYSLFDLPRAWPATTRHREAEGSSYYRHFYMGLLTEDGRPKRALRAFSEYTPHLGICQWFHFEDPRLDAAVDWFRRLGVRHVRTGVSWADSHRPGAEAWLDRFLRALDEFDVTITFCFTPESRGLTPHHSSPPACVDEYADFCGFVLRRYAGAGV
jgi:beta-xylosidase